MNKNQSVSTENQMRKKEASEWMRYAKEDYNLVQHLYRGDYYPKPLAIICYHCEQATEKATTLVDKDGRERKISKPVLEWEIMSLVSQGFTDIILTVSYRSDQIMSYFGNTMLDVGFQSQRNILRI